MRWKPVLTLVLAAHFTVPVLYSHYDAVYLGCHSCIMEEHLRFDELNALLLLMCTLNFNREDKESLFISAEKQTTIDKRYCDYFKLSGWIVKLPKRIRKVQHFILLASEELKHTDVNWDSCSLRYLANRWIKMVSCGLMWIVDMKKILG